MRQLRSTSEGRLDDPILLRDADLRRVIDLLNPPGEETRLVGGAVRNALLGLPPGDIDLATSMRPDEVMRRAKAAGLRVVPTGIAHGTVTILSHGKPFEVTTLREDVETDGRHAVVRFGRDFALDAQRRDFTMNALSVGPSGRIFDTVGGVRDLGEGHVRFIGDAATRIREDYLRILRFFRFHATYGIGSLDPEGLAAAAAHSAGLEQLSRERVRAEFLKILVAPGAIAVLQVMRQAGILSFVVPEPVDLDRLARLVTSGSETLDATLRLAALALEDADRIEVLRPALRLTNAECKRLAAALAASFDLGGATDLFDQAILRRMLFKHAREATCDALRLRHASGKGDIGALNAALAFVGETPIPVSPYGSNDLIRRGLSGPALGVAVARLRDLWAKADFPTDPALLESLLDRAIDAG